MFLYKLYTLLYIQVYYFNLFTLANAPHKLRETLIEEERNYRCCSKHLKCCQRPSDPTNFEVRALLVRCQRSSCDKDQLCESNFNNNSKETAFIDLQGDDYANKELKACRKKLVLTIKIINKGITNCKHQYIIIDHVFDSLTNRKQRILNPIVLRIKQHPVVESYGLKFEHTVNGEAQEKVINKEDANYKGCHTATKHPTCGIVKYDEQIVPYSTGFCCSCTPSSKLIRKIRSIEFSFNDRPIERIQNSRQSLGRYTLPGYYKNDEVRYEFTTKGSFQEKPLVINVPERSPENLEYDMVLDSSSERHQKNEEIPLKNDVPEKDELPEDRFQKRGGQDCTDTYTPPDADPFSYHKSAHCLTFSDIWYLVYSLRKPVIQHSLQIEVFEKHECQSGGTYWIDLTKRDPIHVGTSKKQNSDVDFNILVKYKKVESGSGSECAPGLLDFRNRRLLVPEITENTDPFSYPELQGGPDEYLLVNKSLVCATGKACDVAGVGYEAFVKQPNRCSRSRGTCLNNQPKHLWAHDKEAVKQGLIGSYFLKFFGDVANVPYELSKAPNRTNNKTLRLFYKENFITAVDMQIKSDFNVILRRDYLAMITEIYVDSTSPKKTLLTVKVTNSGLVSSVFLVAIKDCPLDMPAIFNNIASKPALIPPQRQHIFSLEIEGELPVNSFHCSAEVVNKKGELIAVRRVRFQKGDRCICIWHCLCACLIADKGLKCKPLSAEHYNAAGFQGGMPIPLHLVQYTFLDDMISLMLYILLFLCLTLLVMGFIKAILGVIFLKIGMWGLDVLLDLPRKMNCYYETSIRHRKVEYNNEGWPIHPDTKELVRNVSLSTEFCINIVFFIIYPFAIMILIIKKLCCPYYTYENQGAEAECYCLDSEDLKKLEARQPIPKKYLPYNARRRNALTPNEVPVKK